jgi:hypothetical protein
MISTVSNKQAYIFDYVQSVADIQPMTHSCTIFSVFPVATGGAGDVLVTITAQTPEERYVDANDNIQSKLNAVIDSYGRAMKQ